MARGSPQPRRRRHEREPASCLDCPWSFVSDVLLPPQREIEQIPGLLRTSLRKNPPHFGRIEEIGAAREVVEFTARRVAQPLEEPLMDRHPEALLGPINDGVGNDSTDRFLEDVLGNSVTRLNRLGNAHGELDKLVIEKWDAPLEAHPHAHLVYAHAEQLR